MSHTPRTELDDQDFESELRAMLARRAADVSPTSAARRPISANGDRTPGTEPISLTNARSPRRSRRILAGAAAIALVGALGVAVATADLGGDEDMATDATAPLDGGSIPPPGAPGWDPTTAPPVWPIVGETRAGVLAADPHVTGGDLATPTGAARAYLADPASLVTVDLAGLVVDETDGTAAVPWSWSERQDETPERGGTGMVHLRDVGDGTAPLWVVVGATTEELDGQAITLEDVRTDGRLLGFAIAAAPPETGVSVSVRIGVGGTFVTTGGDPLPQGTEPPDPSSGELAHLSPDGRAVVDVAVEPGDRVDVLVRAVGGDFLSVTHMAVDVPVPDDPLADPATTVPPRDGPASTEGPAPDAPAAPPGTAPPAVGVTTTAVAGTYRGEEQHVPSAGGCPDLDHVLVSTFELADGTTWDFRADYCGTIDGDAWRGEGTFTFTAPDGATLTGTFTSAASVTSDGEPYDLMITGGAGRWQGASGSCTLDNHLVETGPWTQEQSGTFSCEIIVSAEG